jgi:hypothetical protein
MEESMTASGIVIVDKEDSECAKLGVWRTDDEGMITVVDVGTFPSTTTKLGGHAGDPESLARVILSEF